jgi:hypothetical protein
MGLRCKDGGLTRTLGVVRTLGRLPSRASAVFEGMLIDRL